jgi:hypothetical protein
MVRSWHQEIAYRMAQREHYEQEMNDWYERHYHPDKSGELIPKQTLDMPAVILIQPKKVIDNKPLPIRKGIEL